MDGATRDPYTPEQCEKLETGLRILARVIVREHLRRQAASTGADGSEPETPALEDHSGQSATFS